MIKSNKFAKKNRKKLLDLFIYKMNANIYQK